MAATVWEGLVRGDLSYEEIIQWLESRDDAEILNSKIFTSRRDEFVELFQRNLRDEAARIFTATAEYCTSPKKAIRVAHSFKNRCRNAHSKEKDHFPPIRPMRAHNSNTLPDSYIKSQKQNVPQVRADTSANGSGSKPYRNDSRPQQRKWRQFNPRNANTGHAQDSNCAASDYNGANSYRSSGYEKRAGPNRQKQSNNAGGFKRPQCGNVSLGDFVKGDNRQRKEKSMHPKESSPRRINPTFLGSCGAYPKNKSQRRFHSENWDNDNNFPRPVKGGCDASIPYRSGKYAPIEIPPSTEDWEAEMAAAAAAASSGPGKYVPIEIPPSTEDWEAEMAAAAAAASSGPGKYAPIEIPPSTEDWEAEMAAAAAAASSGPGKYAPIEIPPSTEDWEAEMAAAAASRNVASDVAKVLTATEEWDSDSFADSPGEMGSEDDFSFERLLLKVERLKSQHWSAKLSANAGLPAADFKLPPAFLEKVTDKDRLDTLIAVYCYILRSNLTLNPSSEMCFLANLLVVSCPPGPEPEPQSLLDSVHNCVYFAGTVLEKSSHLLAMFDRTALKLLLRNDRLSKCVPDFNDELKKLFGDVKTLGEYPNRDGSFANVNFKPETDSKFNFPSDFFFISFKKQRDGFYEALETWEAGHSLPRWSFAQSLGAKVKAIVGGGNEEPVNFVHFCRLFRDQLLGNCSGTLESGEDDLDEDTRCFLKSLKSQDPSKYARLSERLSRPRHSHPTQRSDFPGHQEFYKEFILSANNAKLNAHMIDAFISEISTICAVSEVNLRLEDYDDCGARVVDEKTSQVYATTVASLRVLAKFLGFLVFIPYRSTVRINCDIASKHAEARANTHPPVDVRLALQKAINSNNLVLAVPWVTKFLSMADPVSMAMPYFVSVTRMLFQLYKTVGIDENKTCPSTKLLVQLSLGWLFESSCFPGGQYFGWYFDDDCPETFVSLPIEGEIGKMDTGLDCIPFASRPNVLQAACPGLRRITVMLATRGGNASRFVTPSAVPWRKESKEATWRKVEETFFQGQVPDVERTVFYVAEKIGSSTISFVRTKYLPDLRAEALEEIEPEIMKLGPYQRNKFSRNWSVTSLKKCSEKLQSMCTEQTAAALKALLPMHMGPGTIDFSAAVAARIALKKAVAWLNDLAYSDYFKLGLSDDLEKLHRKSWKVHHAKLRYEPKTSHAIDAKLRSVDHDNNAASPAQSIIELRALMLSIIDGTMLNVNQIEMAFNNVKDTCQRREDLAPAAERIMQTLIMDVLFGLVLKQPDVLMAVMPLARTLWALPELKLTPIDATNFVSPVQLTALSKIDIQPSNVEGFFTLLDSVVNGSSEAKYLLQRRMGNMEATPKGYYGVSSIIIKAIWHIATSQTKTYDI